jgi:RNA polymerase sigma factor (sigma-70 family)
MLADHPTEPTAEDRHRAVCAALVGAPGLIRYAARFTRSIEDAEDAYQRSMEIALVRAPVVEPAAFSSWLHVVIRNEALAIADTRRRERPVAGDDLASEVEDDRAVAVAEPDAVMEWRERYRAVQDALCGLTNPQRLCLMLRSAGLSREEIASITGFSDRKVHRSIVEGRSRLHAWEIRMADGAECERAGELIDMTIEETATRRERRALSRHLHHCHVCRSRYRVRRSQVTSLRSLVPVALAGGALLPQSPPDPGFAMAWWERVTASAGARTVQLVQVMADLPALASSKAGAGAIAAAAAGAIGAPVMIDAVRADHAIERPAVVRADIAARPALPGTATPRVSTTPPPLRTGGPVPARAPAATRPAARSGATTTAARARRAVPVARTGSAAASPALEFGP